MKHFILVISLLACHDLFSQSNQITGVILDGNTPAVGITLLVKGTSNGAITDEEGKFALVASPGNTVIISGGFDPQEFLVTNEKVYTITLESQVFEADDVIITALGQVSQSRSLGYAVQQIQNRDISEVQDPNFLNNLAGKVAGVTITQGPTGVGSTSKITIRGEASFTNNNPLFVVDGIVINNQTLVNSTTDAAAGFQEIDFGNGAMSINPADVASISVLKGPGAAALYGTRAANGVILITTKDGSEKRGSGVSFTSSAYFEQPFQLPRFQNQYGQGNSGQFEFVDGLGGGTNDNITYSYGPALDQGLLIPQYDSPVTLPDGSIVRGGDVAVHGGAPITPTPFVSNPDNLRDFYETGLTTINNLSFSNSFENGHYRLSLGDMRSKSIIPGVNLDRQNVAARLSFEPVDGLTVSANVNYIRSQSDNRPANGYGSENINYSLVAWLGRQTDLNPLKEYWQPGLKDLQQYSFNYTFFDNPYFILLENRNAFQRDRMFGNVQASYELNEYLNVQVRTGMDYSSEGRQFRRAFSSNRFRTGAYAEQNVLFREINSDVLLNYAQSIGDLSVSVSLGANRMDQQAANTQTQAISLAQPGVFKLSNAAAPLEIFQYEARKRINSAYGLLKLSYHNTLFLDITGRNDWSSSLATPGSTDNVSFFYPSVSSALVISELLKLPAVISFAKLRAGWAQVGNDTDPYQTTGVFFSQTPVNSQPTFSDQDRIANGSLLPEQTTSIEFGADIRLFNDYLTFDVTYYDALTENQIISLPIAISSGYNEQVVNGGAVRSRGWEAVMGIRPIYNSKVRWRMMFNFNRNVSTVESLPEQTDRITLAYTRVYDNVNQTVWYQVREGDQIGDMWGTGYLKNEDGEFIVNDEGRLIVDNTLQKLGNYNPDFILGFSNRVEVGGFDFSMLWDWRQGGTIISRTLSLAAVGGQLEETAFRPEEGLVIDGVVNTGTLETPNYVANAVAIPAETYYRSYYDRNHEENNAYSATFVKLRELAVGYTLSSENSGLTWLTEGRQIRFSVIGRNLLAFSEIPHFDPEQFSVQGQNFVSGVEDMSYPTVRSIGVNIGIHF